VTDFWYETAHEEIRNQVHNRTIEYILKMQQTMHSLLSSVRCLAHAVQVKLLQCLAICILISF